MTKIEFSKIFGCAHSYLCEVEQNQKNLTYNKLIMGLSDLGISYETYQNLEKYKQKIEKMDIEYTKKFQLLLLKAIVTLEKIKQLN